MPLCVGKEASTLSPDVFTSGPHPSDSLPLTTPGQREMSITPRNTIKIDNKVKKKSLVSGWETLRPSYRLPWPSPTHGLWTRPFYSAHTFQTSRSGRGPYTRTSLWGSPSFEGVITSMLYIHLMARRRPDRSPAQTSLWS